MTRRTHTHFTLRHVRQLTTARLCVLLLALFAMLAVATAATSPEHLHLKPPANGCDICFTAHLASFEAKTASAILIAPQVHVQLAASAAVSGYQLFRGKAALTRGPPSFPTAAA